MIDAIAISTSELDYLVGGQGGKHLTRVAQFGRALAF